MGKSCKQKNKHNQTNDFIKSCLLILLDIFDKTAKFPCRY